MKIDREQAIKIIAANEVVNISKEDRELLIYNSWGLDETDKEFYLLPTDLRKELLDFDEPQENIMSSKYDKLVKISCESSYEQYTNEKLANIVMEILKCKVVIIGQNPLKHSCPCCGKNTLSICGEYDICSCCGWEDDGIIDEEKYSNPNHMTLKQGKNNYRLYGKCIKSANS